MELDEQQKKPEIWDAFREEHFEVLEQLPLSIHRQFILLRELDQQLRRQNASLWTTTRQYLSSRTPLPSDAHTRNDLLIRLSRISEELSRTSEEKVHLAQSTCNSVKRHIHILDQAIREQSSSLDDPSSTQIKHSLPDLVVTRWTRPPRVTLSPLPDIRSTSEVLSVSATRDEEIPIAVAEAMQDFSPPQPRKSKSKKSSKSAKWTANNANNDASVAEAIIDPKEPRYCYCNQVSFGEMIGCDNKRCKREWFHLSCVGLTEPPDKIGNWYCQDCQSLRTSKRKR